MYLLYGTTKKYLFWLLVILYNMRELSIMKYLTKLKALAKQFYNAYRNEVKDIIIYGSAVKGKSEPRDIDIVIFSAAQAKRMLELAQLLKQKIENSMNVTADVRAINLSELFDTSFLARHWIISEGVSLLHNKKLSEILGFESLVMFIFSARNLNHAEKTRFQYALKGRRNAVGMIADTKGQHLSPGMVLVPVENSIIFESFLKSWKLDYSKKIILIAMA
jgi:predicted nucleotidyltransferase